MAPEPRQPFTLELGPAAGPAQLLLDLSVLVETDERSGVQRLTRNIARALLRSPPPGYSVTPVYDAGGYYAYATEFLIGTEAAEAEQLADEPIRVRPGDIFLGLDLCPNHVPGNRALLASLRKHGVRVVFVVYDLLPVRLAQYFIPGATPWFEAWLNTVSGVADGLVCISRAVADDLLDWLDERAVPNPGTLQVGYFPLGADLDAGVATQPLRADEQVALTQLEGRPALLMVGTVEPRKMHAQALDAFECLWRAEVDVSLVIVGRAGWLVDALAARLAEHPELNRRLFWLEGASDSALQRLYGQCAGLLAASSGEGFGLPLIEAAQYGLPIIARDLPVFREVAGEHAWYFEAADGVELAGALQAWLALHARGAAPGSTGMAWLTWDASARQLFDIIDQQRWYRRASFTLA